MKIAAVAFALTLAWMIGPLAHASADEPGSDWMPREQIRQKLLEAGYTEITELEADDGHWEGEGVKGGKRVEFHLDPNSGAVLSEKVKKSDKE